jgi:hypothetical protein
MCIVSSNAQPEKNIVETSNIRKVNPIIAFVAGFLGFGTGYVYVGRLRYGVAAYIGFYLTLALFFWTRLVMLSAAMWWLLCVCCLLICGIALIHPIVLARRHRQVPSRRYNQWWVYVIWAVAGTAFAWLIAKNRTTVLGYEPFNIPSPSSLLPWSRAILC